MAAQDYISQIYRTLSGPSADFGPVTPHNSNNFASPCRALYAGVSGNISVVPLVGDGTPVLFKNVPAGVPIPVVAVRVNSTGTTATDIVALF